MEQTPGWWFRHGRMVGLLTMLGVAVLCLLGSQTSLLQAGSSSKEPTAWCIPAGLPAPAVVNLNGLQRLRRDLLTVIAPLGSPRYAYGTIDTGSLWSENLPELPGRSRSLLGLWPASYEMRVWVANRADGGRDDVVAAVLEFTTAAQARRVFDEAAGANCHRAALVQQAPRPRGARNLAWINPDDVAQEDVLLLRGSRLYRVDDVQPQRVAERPSNRVSAPGFSIVDRLACGLPEAGCSPSSPSTAASATAAAPES
jgi:hypothetical protein